MEACPYCGKYVSNLDIHFRLSPKCNLSWNEERQRIISSCLTLKAPDLP